MKGTKCTATSSRLIEEDLILVPLTLITVWMKLENSIFYVCLPRNCIRCRNICKTIFYYFCSDSQLHYRRVDNLLCCHLSGGHHWQQSGHVCCLCVQVNYFTLVYCTVLCKTILILRRMQTVTNFYIANLALSDVVLALFRIPFQFRAALMQRWDLPEFMCQFCPFMQTLSVCNNDKLLVLNMIKTR